MAARPKAQPKSTRADANRRPGKNASTTLGKVAAELASLESRLSEMSDLGAVSGVLSWDQAVLMPPGGAAARSRQRARLARLHHERATDPELGRLLDRLGRHAEGLAENDDTRALIRVARRDYDLAVRVPTEYAVRASEHGSASYQAWTVARPANDFASMRPLLETSLALSREYTDFFPGWRHVMDPHIGPEEGLTTAEVDRLFSILRQRLVPLVKRITAAPLADDSCLRQAYPEALQLNFAADMASLFGYDLGRGRIDKSPHPFCTRFSRDDVRITTRVQERDLSDALFSVLHEVGHALYEMGIAPAIDGTPLGHGASDGVHESQSRLWENIIGRSRAFWEYAYPLLRKVFPDQLGSVPLDTFHRAINKVARTLIRTDADELTYNLHVLIRFDLEKQMLEGRLAVADLPDAWVARYESDLGVSPPDHRDGVLQDVHWFAGGIGGVFQGYTIGNILSVQLYDAALAAHPEIAPAIGRGDFKQLREWLGENVHRHGRRLTGPELTVKATGKDLTIEPYMRYLETKYAALYPDV